MPLHPGVALAHEAAHHRGGEAQDGEAVARHQGPEAVRGGVVGGAIVEDDRGAEGQGAEDGPGAHHPAEVGQPEEAVVLLDIEAVGHILGGLEGEAGVDVHCALGPPGCPRGVEEQTRVLGVGPLGRGVGWLGRHQVVPPDIAPAGPGHRPAEAAADEHVLDGGRLGHGRVGRLLHRHRLPAAEEAIGGDEQRGLAVGQTGGHGGGGVAGEDGDADGADLGAGQHRHGGFGGERQEEADAVAPADAERAQGVGGAVGLGEQLGVGELAHLAFLALPEDGQSVAAGRGGVLVQGVVDAVVAAALEPRRPGDAARGIEHLLVGLVEREVEVLDDRVPEPGGVGGGAGHEGGDIGDAVPLHEPPEPRPLDLLARWLPDNLVRRLDGHGSSPTPAARPAGRFVGAGRKCAFRAGRPSSRGPEPATGLIALSALACQAPRACCCPSG